MGDNSRAFLSVQTVARALGGEVVGGQVRAPGPGHSPGDRSLSVKLDADAPDGFVVSTFSPKDDPLACKDYVREKLGLPAFKPNGNSRVSEDVIEKAVMAAVMGQTRRAGRVVATHDYTDADGTLLYQVQREEPKNFPQRQPNGNGGWINNLQGFQRRVLYRWPELLAYPDATVFFCEGEKDADRVASLGQCATTVASGKWTGECVQALAGRNVLILEDNDESGRKRAWAAAEALHGTAKTIRIVRLPDLGQGGDISDWLDADSRRTIDQLIDLCFATPVWTPDATPLPDTQNATPVHTAAAAVPPPSLLFLNISAWQDAPVPERAWIVKDRIPENAVTLLSGEGSVGKSILALQLSTAIVLGRDWLGALPDPGPAVVVCCEDDADELWRRLDRIRGHYGAAYADLKNLKLLSLAGQETVMAAPNRAGLIQPTPLFKQLRAAVCDLKPRLCVLDNAADIFAGNENDRAQVRQFISLLHGIALAANCGVLLTSHPSLTGITTGSGLSGSTAWNASVRSRLYFKRATTAKDEEPDPDLRVLEVMKANYGPIGESLTLRWKDGLFLPVAGASSLERLAAERAVDQLFLALLARFTHQGRSVSHKPTSHCYAPSAFAADPEAKAMHATKRQLGAAMERLFATNSVHVETYGRPSRQASRLVIGPAPEA